MNFNKFNRELIYFTLLTTIFLLMTISNIESGIATQNNNNKQVSNELINAFPNLTFNNPVDFQSARDDSNRLFVVEQAGRIKVFDNTLTTTQSNTFLDITDRVIYGGERGLLGLAFHPNFEENGLFYVDYTASPDGRTVISQFNTSSPSAGDPSSEVVIMEISQPYANHNGGQIFFGLDGFLYIALGDGGFAGDPQDNGQSKSTLLGKILRIDVDNKENGKNYGIPADNPYKDNTDGFKEEIFAYGLRNPWRISQDHITGDIWTGDVGQNAKEELNIIEKGKNYGWNTMEGFSCYEPISNCNKTSLELPVYEYDRDDGISVTGGYVYRGSISSLNGTYIYGDFGSGKIWSLKYEEKILISNTELFDTDFNIASFGVDQEYELYILAYSGSIYKFKIDEIQSDDESSSSSNSESTSVANTAIGFTEINLILILVLVSLKRKKIN